MFQLDMSKINLFIFDVGGVMCANNEPEPLIASRFGLSPEELRSLTGDLVEQLSTGGIGPEQYWREFSRRTGLQVSGEPWIDCFRTTLRPEMVDIARRAASRGRVVAGTNTIEPHYRLHLRRGHYRVFDAVYPSHRLGVAKPDPEFYRRILEAEGRTPEETVFVDDLPENVEGASVLGIRSFLFRDSGTLEHELSQIIEEKKKNGREKSLQNPDDR